MSGRPRGEGAARRKGIFNTRESICVSWEQQKKIWLDAFSHVLENMWEPKWQEFTTLPESPAFKHLLCIQDLLQLYDLQQLHNLLQSQKDESGLWLLLREIFPVLCQFQEQQRKWYLLHTPHKIQHSPRLEASTSWEDFNKWQLSRHDPSSLSGPARKSGLQGVCTFKKRIPNSQEQAKRSCTVWQLPFHTA